MKKIALVLMLVLSVVFFAGTNGCDDKGEQISRSGAKQVTEFFKFPVNSSGMTVEQQNIMDRYKVTTDTTKVLWIHLISLDGKILRRMPVRNKVTSSGKRLEPVEAAYGEYVSYAPNFGAYRTPEFIQADGTYGSSDEYIYWFDPMGRYHQWGTAGGLGYLVTDYPIDLANPIDEITGLYNVHQAAAKWQAEQEATLRVQQSQEK